MKKDYLKNVFLSQLKNKSALEILKASLLKIEENELLDEIIYNIKSDEIDDLLRMLSSSTYDLNQSVLSIILTKFPLAKSTYLLFKNLKFIATQEIIYESESSRNFLLNYCFLREQMKNYERFELFNDNTLLQTINLEKPEFRNDFAISRYHSLLCLMFHNLKYKKITSLNLESFKNLLSPGDLRIIIENQFKGDISIVSEILISSLMKIVKDPLLRAIIDENGRVNSISYVKQDLILVPYKQIYNLQHSDGIFICLCQQNSSEGLCKICNHPAALLSNQDLIFDVENSFKRNLKENVNSNPKVIFDSKSSLIQQSSFKPDYSSCDLNSYTRELIENLMLQPDIDFNSIFKLIQHCSWLRSNEYFKIVLKQYLTAKKKVPKADKCTFNFSPNLIEKEETDENYLKLFEYFEMNTEIESTVISFFKASSSYFTKAIAIIPYFMKTPRLYFACFICLLQCSEKNEYFRILAKNLIHRYNLKFLSVIDLILEFTTKIAPMNQNTQTEAKDKDFLIYKMSKIADLFSQTPESFVNQNFHSIFNSYFPSPNFSDEFIQYNIKYLIIQKVIDNNFNSQIDDVDILVGLMFQNHFSELDQFFKPSVNLFIKKNLSHILFKVKNAYSLKLYNRKTCIYKILKFILTQVNVPLYFSYLWPYIEFFLNSEYCVCAGYVLEWVRGCYDSKLMAPYLMTPFENIEDFPLLPNIESKIYPMLARFFSNYKIPFEYSNCPFQENLKNIQNSISNQTSVLVSESITSLFDPSKIKRIYRSLRESLPLYSPMTLIDDEHFIENFIDHFKKTKGFKSKICKLQGNSLSIETRALFGNIKYDASVDSFPKAPENIPKSILENFLLKINYERQDLFAFTIQEFLKNISESFEPEIENFVQQFRHTKFEYKITLKEMNTLDFSTYRNFLESLFYLLYLKIKKLSFFKYLILFDDKTVEYSCLCMIKIVSDACMKECISIFQNLPTTNVEILKFILKINTFVGKSIITKGDMIKYSLFTRDYYSLIYNLEDEETDNDILQISYFMVGNNVRVRGFNVISAFKSYSTLNLFFDFLIDKNYKASEACLNEILNSQFKDQNMDVKNNLIALPDRNNFVSAVLKEIANGNADHEVELLVSGKYSNHPGVSYHILKDLELLLNSHNIDKTVNLINQRRNLADDSFLILKIHKYLEPKINIEGFSKSVDQELINYYIQKKDYLRAEEEIAKFLLRKDFTALFNLVQIKIETKHFDEAKELLKRMQFNCEQTSKEYFQATVKLSEICPSKALFESGITVLENAFCEVIGEPKEDLNDIGTQKNSLNSAKNRISLLKLESICKKLEGNKRPNGSTSSNNPSISHAIELFNNLQKLYFLTAKYFEKYNQLISIKYYFKSLISNHEAIPRFFHLLASTNRTQFKIIGEMIDIIIKEYLQNLIPFYKQISTKIALDTDASKFFKLIISEMLEAFPYQTHWNSLFLYNSKKPEVAKIMSEIVEGLSIEKRSLFMNIKNCSEKLTNIAKSSAKTLSMADFPDVRNIFPAQINVPGEMTEINNIKNEILIFRSLQMPKKITFIGENGKEYPMIVKFKDDLRKDSRFMDLNDLLNKLFDEGYYIRKYNVIPFTHESGIIEFIPNLTNLKEIVTSVHKNTMETIQRFVKTKMIGHNNIEALEKSFKPVFNQYLKDVYNDPYLFYKNRENYIKTYAIMNIVGWYMGLGDRHAENIHFDKITGDTVHVDLNCIFEKGKTLEIPEKVPFRLTQNIVDGFGVLKLEGTYRHTMKYTLQLLKENRDVIQANLLSFVFDPLLEWARKKTEPSKIIEGMDEKLDFEDFDHKIQELIDEATDYNNLGSMYIGWMAFI